MSTRLCPDHNEILIDGEECSLCKAELDALPATPAPESPAPAPAGFATWWESYRRWDDDFRYPASEEGEHKATAFAAWQAAQSPVTPVDIGTGSETSPDAGAPKREATPNVPLAKKPMRYDESWRLIELMVQYLETDRIMGVRVPETSLDWVRAAKAYLAAHPVAEAEQSPLPAALDALRKLERACQDLGSTALPVWDYNPPDYLKKEWEVLADMLVEVAPALAQAPTRNAGEAQ